MMKKRYDILISELKDQLESLKYELSKISNGDTSFNTWIEKFRENCNLTELSRQAVVTFVESIKVHEDKVVELNMMYQEEVVLFEQWIRESLETKAVAN